MLRCRLRNAPKGYVLHTKAFSNYYYHTEFWEKFTVKKFSSEACCDQKLNTPNIFTIELIETMKYFQLTQYYQ